MFGSRDEQRGEGDRRRRHEQQQQRHAGTRPTPVPTVRRSRGIALAGVPWRVCGAGHPPRHTANITLAFQNRCPMPRSPLGALPLHRGLAVGATLAEQPRDHQQRHDGEQPGHHALGDRARCDRCPSRRDCRGAGCSARSARSSRSGARRARLGRTAASRTGRSGSPLRSGVGVACVSAGTIAPVTIAALRPGSCGSRRSPARTAAGLPRASPRAGMHGRDRGPAEGRDVGDQRADPGLRESRPSCAAAAARSRAAACARSPGRSRRPARRRRAGSARGRGCPRGDAVAGGAGGLEQGVALGRERGDRVAPAPRRAAAACGPAGGEVHQRQAAHARRTAAIARRRAGRGLTGPPASVLVTPGPLGAPAWRRGVAGAAPRPAARPSRATIAKKPITTPPPTHIIAPAACWSASAETPSARAGDR